MPPGGRPRLLGVVLSREAREPEFVGREAELKIVDEQLLRLGGGLSALVVTGEPGIGKTRFLGELRRRARLRGWTVAAGQATGHERGLPFSAVADALTPRVLADPSVLAALPGRLGEAITAVLPAVGTGPASAGIRHHAYLATAGLLELLCAPAPLLVVLDDVHWADEGTVELVDHLLRHRTAGRVLLAVGCRPRQAPGRLAGVLAAATAAGTASQVRLGGLSVEQTALLLGRDAADPEARRLHEATEGNPLYAGTLARTGAAADPRAALLAEVERLPAGPRAVLDAAAVLGTAFQPEPLPEVAHVPPVQVWAALDELVAADLLRPGAGTALRFRHPLIRQVVYEAAGVGWRRTAHARTVRALTTRGAPADLLASHVAQAAVVGDETAIRVLLRAATADRWRAPATAAQWYESALRLLPTDRRHPARRARLLLARAECLVTAGELDRAHEVISEALPLLRNRARPVLRRAVRLAAAVSQLRGSSDEAAALLRQAAGQRGLTDPALRLQLATIELLRGNLPVAWELADGAPSGFGASCVVAFVHASAGDAPAAARAADTALALLDATPDAELRRRLGAALWLMWACVALARHQRALDLQERAIALCRAGGRSQQLAQWLIGRAETLRRTGRLAQARRAAEEAEDLALLSGSAQLRLFAATTRCRVAVSRGDAGAAGELAARVRALAAGHTGLFASLGLAVAAEASLLCGEPAECTSGVLAAGGGEALRLFDPSSRVMLYELLTRAALAAAELPRARHWARLAGEARRAGVLACSAGLACLATARVLLAQDRPGDALAAARSAAAELATGDPVELARARLLEGRAAAALGRRAEALAALHEVAGAAGRCGADGLRDEATQELRRLGHRVPATGPRGLDVLSQREWQVAELAAGGRTNRAIAAALYLSEKTVERHLSSAYAKLGVPSRAALAARVVVSHPTARTPAPAGR